MAACGSADPVQMRNQDRLAGRSSILAEDEFFYLVDRVVRQVLVDLRNHPVADLLVQAFAHLTQDRGRGNKDDLVELALVRTLVEIIRQVGDKVVLGKRMPVSFRNRAAMDLRSVVEASGPVGHLILVGRIVLGIFPEDFEIGKPFVSLVLQEQGLGAVGDDNPAPLFQPDCFFHGVLLLSQACLTKTRPGAIRSLAKTRKHAIDRQNYQRRREKAFRVHLQSCINQVVGTFSESLHPTWEELMKKPAICLAAAVLALGSSIALAGETPAPEGARVYFINLKDGDKVTSPVTVQFGLAGMGVAPAGTEKEHTGHHHILIDATLEGEALNEPILADDNHKHFGGGQTEAIIELPPGEHTLQLVLGDWTHIPHNPPVMSERITIIVE